MNHIETLAIELEVLAISFEGTSKLRSILANPRIHLVSDLTYPEYTHLFWLDL